MRQAQAWRNRLGYGIGTIGRDMVAAMVTMYLMFYATEILRVSNRTLGMMTAVMVFMRIFDGANDPFMGTLVDSTRSRWGKFKPWILGGAILWALFHVLMFYDFGLRGLPFIIVFTLLYLGWEISYTANDIAYWSMTPALSRTQAEREKIGAVARICASIGMFTFVVALIPVSNLLTAATGSPVRGWFALAVGTAFLMLFFQAFTLLFVKETSIPQPPGETTGFGEVFRIIFRNDQLLTVTVAMLFFMAGYTATTGLGIYYFKYIFGDENMYSVFALILGISQIAGLTVFPLISKHLRRSRVFALSIGLVLLGYLGFYLSPRQMLPIGISGVLIFVGQAFLQILMLMFIADCVEYGQWKLGKRSESVTFSLQPLIYKISNAAATGLMGIAVISSGLREAEQGARVTAEGARIFKLLMMAVPAVLIMISYLVMKRFYRIDETFYSQVVAENLAAEARLTAGKKTEGAARED